LDSFVNDETLFVYASLDGQNVKDSNDINPIEIDLEGPMEIFLQINVSSTVDLNITGSINFYYQGIAIFPIQIVDPVTNSTWIWLDHEHDIPPVAAMIDLSTVLSYGSIKLATGIFEASMDFRYYLDGDTTTEYVLSNKFYFFIPSTPQDVFTSVTGISATVATVGAI